MKKLDFTEVELASAIRHQLKVNREVLNNGEEVKNLPVLVFEQPVETISEAKIILASLLDYENISVLKLERSNGQDDIPPRIMVADLDELSLLAIAGDSLYVLDKHLYQVRYPKKGIFTLSKKKGQSALYK